MTIREGYEMCYFGSTEYKRVEEQQYTSYISPKYNKN